MVVRREEEYVGSGRSKRVSVSNFGSAWRPFLVCLVFVFLRLEQA